jgi:ectoine hydroxylase
MTGAARWARDALADNGFAIIPAVLGQMQLSDLDRFVQGLGEYQGPGVARTASGEILSVVGIHLVEPALVDLIVEPALLGAVEKLVGTPVYIYQSSLHLKPVSCPVLGWHQDFNAFNRFDGLPEARGVTLAFFIDEITELNAPVHAISGSHRVGHLPAERTPPTNYYEISAPTINDLVAKGAVVPLLGAAGSLLVMDFNLVHASGTPLLPHRRAILYFNLVSVSVTCTRPTRPPFVASRQAVPLAARASSPNVP